MSINSFFDKLVINAEKSAFIGFANRVLKAFQSKLMPVVSGSFFFENIDYVIMFFLTMALSLSLFASTTVIGVCVWLGFALFLLKILSSEFEIKLDIIDICVLLWLASLLISTAFSSLPHQSLWGLNKMLTYLMFYSVFKNVIAVDKKRIFYFIFLIAALVSLESLYVIRQNFVGVEEISGWQDMSNLNAEQVLTRVYGTLKPYNPNLLAGYLLACFPFALGSFFFVIRDKKYRFCALSAIMIGCVALSILFTGCRGAYIGLLAEFAAFSAIFSYFLSNELKDNERLKKIWIWFLSLIALAVVLLIFSSEALQARILSIFSYRDDSSNSFRVNVYQASFRMFLDNWVVGIGIGNKVFREIYGLYMRSGFDALGAYSIYLETAVETGIVGLVAFLSFIGVIITKALQSLKSKLSFDSIIFASIVLVALAGLLSHGIADTIWYRPQVQLIFWVLTSLISVISCKNCGENKNE